jgi:hypothetical protein
LAGLFGRSSRGFNDFLGDLGFLGDIFARFHGFRFLESVVPDRRFDLANLFLSWRSRSDGYPSFGFWRGGFGDGATAVHERFDQGHFGIVETC